MAYDTENISSHIWKNFVYLIIVCFMLHLSFETGKISRKSQIRNSSNAGISKHLGLNLTMFHKFRQFRIFSNHKQIIFDGQYQLSKYSFQQSVLQLKSSKEQQDQILASLSVQQLKMEMTTNFMMIPKYQRMILPNLIQMKTKNKIHNRR